MSWWIWAGLVYLLLLPAITQVCYLAVMALKDNEDELSTEVLVFGYLFLFLIAYPHDILLRFTWGILLFIELPPILKGTVIIKGSQYTIYYPEMLVTQLVSRHLKESTGYKYNLSRYFCSVWLGPFDKDNVHCDE